MAELKTTFTGDARGFTATLKSVETQANGLQKALQAGMTGGLGGISNIAKLAAGGGAMVAGVAGVAALGAAAFKTAQAYADIGDEADRAGVSTEFFQRATHAAELTNSSAEEVVRAMQKLSASIDIGGKEAENKFKKYGLSMKELSALTSEARFMKVAEAINKQSTETQKGSMAFDLMGKQARNLVPALDEIAKASGNIVSDDVIKQAQKFDDALKSLWQWTKAQPGALLQMGEDILSGDPTGVERRMRRRAELEQKDAAQRKAAAEDAAADAEEKEKGRVKKVGEQSTDIANEIKVAELRAQGLEKEAELTAKIQSIRKSMEKEGGLKPEDEARLREQLGRLYETKDFKGNLQDIKGPALTSAQQIGGTGFIGDIAGAASGFRSALAGDKTMDRTDRRVAQIVDQLTTLIDATRAGQSVTIAL